MLGLIVALMFMPQATTAFYAMVGRHLLRLLLILPSARRTCRWSSPCSTPTPASDAAMGFMLDNKIQIITGRSNGSSGFILSCSCAGDEPLHDQRALGAFGKVQEKARRGAARQRSPSASSPSRKRRKLMGTARSVVFVPGYGMAVSQAQHRVGRWPDVLKGKAVQVRYGIHASPDGCRDT